MDMLMAFFLIGWLGATGMMGLAWYVWALRNVRRTDDCRWCGRVCSYCWPEEAVDVDD